MGVSVYDPGHLDRTYLGVQYRVPEDEMPRPEEVEEERLDDRQVQEVVHHVQHALRARRRRHVCFNTDRRRGAGPGADLDDTIESP